MTLFEPAIFLHYLLSVDYLAAAANTLWISLAAPLRHVAKPLMVPVDGHDAAHDAGPVLEAAKGSIAGGASRLLPPLHHP